MQRTERHAGNLRCLLRSVRRQVHCPRLLFTSSIGGGSSALTEIGRRRHPVAHYPCPQSIGLAAEPIEPFHSGYIDVTRSPIATRCRYDVAGMRSEPRVAFALAQLYRDHVNHANFRKREIVAAEATRAMLLAALSRVQF